MWYLSLLPSLREARQNNNNKRYLPRLGGAHRWPSNWEAQCFASRWCGHMCGLSNYILLPPLCGVEKRAFPWNSLAPTPTMWSFVRRPRSLPLQKQGGDFFHPWICVCMCRLPYYMKIAMLGLLSDIWGPVKGVNFILLRTEYIMFKVGICFFIIILLTNYLNGCFFLQYLIYFFYNILFCVVFPSQCYVYIEFHGYSLHSVRIDENLHPIHFIL